MELERCEPSIATTALKMQFFAKQCITFLIAKKMSINMYILSNPFFLQTSLYTGEYFIRNKKVASLKFPTSSVSVRLNNVMFSKEERKLKRENKLDGKKEIHKKKNSFILIFLLRLAFHLAFRSL